MQMIKLKNLLNERRYKSYTVLPKNLKEFPVFGSLDNMKKFKVGDTMDYYEIPTGKIIKLKITQDYQTTDLSKMNLADKKRHREVKAQIQTNSGKYSWNQKTIRNPNMSYHIKAEKV